ncbi:gag/pol protein [Cucumis melo var. makuwa]|uniref:Gag/pol protein n=2 Tax=Cucumis melo var. makuwa TaxID=1194695 RepID=A0A5A7VAU1_CUCMM|nr:gag/pol protein [Cucumis melo var. makuwa]
MILVIADLRFVLMEECPPFPTTNASQSVRDAYDCWTNANDKAHLYILASMSNILSKKHGIMVTAQMNEAVFNEKSQVFYILKSLPKSFLQFCSNVEMNKIERFVPSSFGSKKIQKRKGGKRKGPTIAVEGKGKAKETSSFKQLEEGEMTLKVETGDVISARAVEDARYGYLYLMEHKSDALEKFKKDKAEVENLLTQFQMKDLGEIQYVLRIQIIRNRKNNTLALSQVTYIDKMLVRYSMQNSKKNLLPFRHGVHLSKEQCPKTPQEARHCYAIGIVSRYQSNPGLDHWTTVKIVLKYLRRTRDYMLVYEAKDLILIGYTDFDFQTDKDSRKSTSGSVFTLNGGTVVWRSIKQGCIADSTMETEYVFYVIYLYILPFSMFEDYFIM